MKIEFKKTLIFIASCTLGILIMLAPTIITKRPYSEDIISGGLLISEFFMRTTSLIIGLLIIYDALKVYSR